MLEAFIIEEIRRLEKEKLSLEYERPRLELPIFQDDLKDPEPSNTGGKVIIIES